MLWKRIQRGFSSTVPSVKGFPLIGTALEIGAAGGAPKLHEYVHRRHSELGPIFKENMGTTTATFVSDPSLIRSVFTVEGKHPKHFVPAAWSLYNRIYNARRGLFFMDGEEWLTHRKLMNKYLLSKDFIQELNAVHSHVVQTLVDSWKRFEGKEIEELGHQFYKHSISFIIGSLMGDSFIVKSQLFQEEISTLAHTFQKVFHTSAQINTAPSVKLLQMLRLSVWKEFESSVTASIEASRRLLSKIQADASPNGLLAGLESEQIPYETITALVVDLLLAAGDTTAYTSQWTLYHLAKDPTLQSRVVGSPEMIRGAVKETLRMYPPAVFVSRFLPQDAVIQGYPFQKGDLIIVSLYTTGRSGNIYPNPNQFDPTRWIKGTVGRYGGVKDPKGFLPFSMGTRSCVGARLATTQLTSTVAEILKKYALESDQSVDMELCLVPVPSKPIKIKISPK